MQRRISVQYEDFDIGAEWLRLRAQQGGTAGAMAAFCGVVRDRVASESVAHLELEHYPGMTERSIEAIIDTAEARWRLESIVVIHRVGLLSPNDQIVLVIATSRHRQDALDACAFVIDLLKTEAVFWKREITATGARWIESTGDDHRRAVDWRATRLDPSVSEED
jgi:molybdopterin synthase catalytic subunit